MEHDETQLAETISSVAALTRSEIDVQISTAKQWPRSITQFRRDAAALACLDSATAEECRYAIPRAGGTIDGPSVRFAEIVASTWGNLRVATRIVGQDDSTITAQGVCHDLERNVCCSSEVQRRIVGRDGRKYNIDLIQLAAMSASSIAKRNSVFSVVPRALWRPVWDRILATIVGDKETLSQRRSELMQWFRGEGVDADRVFELLDVRGIDDIQSTQYLQLQGIRTAINDGATTVEQAFAVKRPAATGARSVGEVAAEALRQSAAQLTAPKPAAKPTRKRRQSKPRADAQATPEPPVAAGPANAAEKPEVAAGGKDGPAAGPGGELCNDVAAWRLLCRGIANQRHVTMGEADSVLAEWFGQSFPDVQPAAMTTGELTSQMYDRAMSECVGATTT